MRTIVWNGKAATALLIASALTLGVSSGPAKSEPGRGNGNPFSHGPSHCCPPGFGGTYPVTLPPDRVPTPGTDTGILVNNGTHREISPPQYFPPR